MATTMVGTVPNVLPDFIKDALVNGTNLAPGNRLLSGATIFEWDPAEVNVQQSSALFKTVTSHHFSRRSEVDRASFVSVEGEVKTARWDVKAQTNCSQSYSGAAAESDVYMVSLLVKREFTATRNLTERRTDKFLESLKTLPGDLKQAGNYLKFKNWFESWGTHYLRQGDFGGAVFMEASIRSTSYTSSTEKDWSGGVQGSFDGVLTSGSLVATAAYKEGNYLAQHASETSATLVVQGGDSPNTGDDLVKTSKKAPVLLVVPQVPELVERDVAVPPVFAPIWELVDDNSVKEAMKQALDMYLPPIPVAIQHLGQTKPIKEGTGYREVDAGFLWTYLNVSQGYRAGGTIELHAPDQSPIAWASVHFDDEKDRWISRASAMVPVPSESEFFRHCGLQTGVNAAAYWTPLTSAELGAPEPITLRSEDVNGMHRFAATGKKGSAGFVLCGLRSGEVKPEETAVSEATLSYGGVLRAATSQHWCTEKQTWFPMESFCVPVPADTEFALTAKGEGKVEVDAVWIPLRGVNLGTPVTMHLGIVHPPVKAGFLVVVLKAEEDGARGFAEVRLGKVGEDLATVSQNTPMAGTSVHFYTPTNTWLKYNTLIMPIREDQSYLVNFVPTSSIPTCDCYFVPIEG